MEMNTAYDVNIISLIDKDRGLFVAVEQFNSGSTGYFQYYYKQLLLFTDCSEWFEKFDYPIVDPGKVVIVQVDKNRNLWARGIISNCHNYNNLNPEVYLIDSQRFTDKDGKLELRTCPPKFLQLTLPTYYIDIDLCLDDDDIKTAIKILIRKNQYGELSFSFTPQSVQNNVYSGELIVNNKVNKLYIPLKKLLKNVHSKKIFEDIPLYKKHQYSNFNPIELKHLKNIFMPRAPSSMVFLESNLVSSSCDLSILDDSSTNLSYNSDNEFSTSNYSENICFSDDSESENQKLQNNCITSIAKQKVYSSNSSLMSKSNSSLQSVNSKKNDCTTPEIKQCSDFTITRMSDLKKDTGCQQNNNLTLTPKVLQTPKIHLKSATTVQPMNTTMDNAEIWWSDDDEN